MTRTAPTTSPRCSSPDPRTLYGELSPGAQFAIDGTTTVNGTTVTHSLRITRRLSTPRPSATSRRVRRSRRSLSGSTQTMSVKQVAFSTSQSDADLQCWPTGRCAGEGALAEEWKVVHHRGRPPRSAEIRRRRRMWLSHLLASDPPQSIRCPRARLTSPARAELVRFAREVSIRGRTFREPSLSV